MSDVLRRLLTPLTMFALVMVAGIYAPQRAAAEPASAAAVGASAAVAKKRIAVIATRYTARSHANALATKFFTGYPSDEGLIEPKLEVVSMYVDQTEPDDMAHQLAEKFGFKVHDSITEALTLGGDTLAVDGVIYIGVHGDYPRSRLGAKMYPHLRHLAEVFAVYDATGETAPIYCDKELGYRWGDAKWIYDRASELDVPMMAGSTLPVVWRDPVIPTPDVKKITEAVAVGYGPLNSYILHSVEILQSMLEHRAGGETGVASVQWVSGPAFYQAVDEGRISMELVQAACERVEARKPGTLRENVPERVHALIIEYRDGTRGVAVDAGRYIGEHFAYAANVEGETVAAEYAMPHTTIFPHFSYLFLNVERMIETGEPAWPLERNLLSNGVIDAAMRSRAAGGAEIPTPHLDIAYSPSATETITPTNPRPTGRSLGPWPPEGFEFTGWDE